MGLEQASAPPKSFGAPIGISEEKVHYTVISEGLDAPSATVVENALAALNVARQEAGKSGGEVTITTDNGWFLTLDQLEEMVKQ
jgi:hypothetical protein